MNNQRIIHRTKLYPIIRATHGKLFGVIFTKKDSTLRRMTAQIRPPKPDAKRPSPAKDSNSYILVGDMAKYLECRKEGKDKAAALNGSYRLINIETITWVKINGVEYTVEG
jgi:hypothetical protein